MPALPSTCPLLPSTGNSTGGLPKCPPPDGIPASVPKGVASLATVETASSVETVLTAGGGPDGVDVWLQAGVQATKQPRNKAAIRSLIAFIRCSKHPVFFARIGERTMLQSACSPSPPQLLNTARRYNRCGGTGDGPSPNRGRHLRVTRIGYGVRFVLRFNGQPRAVN
jgi:hypothetical protein